MSIQLTSGISSLVSVGLAVSYLRIVAGPRFAWVEAGMAQMVYLVLYSYTFFLNGFTGLAITIGCIITLFVAMQVTARTSWSKLFSVMPLAPRAAGVQMIWLQISWEVGRWAGDNSASGTMLSRDKSLVGSARLELDCCKRPSSEPSFLTAAPEGVCDGYWAEIAASFRFKMGLQGQS